MSRKKYIVTLSHLFERANETSPIVRQPTLGDDTHKLDVYLTVANALDISLEEC